MALLLVKAAIAYMKKEIEKCKTGAKKPQLFSTDFIYLHSKLSKDDKWKMISN